MPSYHSLLMDWRSNRRASQPCSHQRRSLALQAARDQLALEYVVCVPHVIQLNPSAASPCCLDEVAPKGVWEANLTAGGTRGISRLAIAEKVLHGLLSRGARAPMRKQPTGSLQFARASPMAAANRTSCWAFLRRTCVLDWEAEGRALVRRHGLFMAGFGSNLWEAVKPGLYICTGPI
jgi:hypothetical protein